jgi:hypothetical protein
VDSIAQRDHNVNSRHDKTSNARKEGRDITSPIGEAITKLLDS